MSENSNVKMKIAVEDSLGEVMAVVEYTSVLCEIGINAIVHISGLCDFDYADLEEMDGCPVLRVQYNDDSLDKADLLSAVRYLVETLNTLGDI